MPYWIYKSWLAEEYSNKKDLKILEVGVDQGQMLFPLVGSLIRESIGFSYIGVDVREDEGVVGKIDSLEKSGRLSEDQSVNYVIANSLKWMPACELTFDIILVDGDHNYFTVQQELTHLDKMLNEDGVVLVDDYNGKWSERDLYYSTRPTHEGVENVTGVQDTKKHGVRAAIDDFLATNDSWEMTAPLGGESVMLRRANSAKH